jgi:cysteine desulfurase
VIYADANGTYPVAPEHYDQVAARLKVVDGNPSSIHASGRNAKVALEAARASVARLLGAKSQDLVFTSGATEANNLAIQGVIGRRARGVTLPGLVVVATEHASVLETSRLLAERGLCALKIAPVDVNGQVDGEELLSLVGPETVMVCLMLANNETGVVQPLADLAARIKQKNPAVHVHSDAVQSLGKAPLAWLGASAVDSAAFSGHKLGAFKGVGALYLKGGSKLQLLLIGGGQERGRRPGTENMPGIVSFGLRADQVHGREADAGGRMRRLADGFKELLAGIPGAVIHGAGARESLPNTVNFHLGGVPGDDILLNFDLAGIQASSGSACSSGVARPSHVLMAMGLGEWVALNSVRVSFTADGPESELARMRGVLLEVVGRVRRS